MKKILVTLGLMASLAGAKDLTGKLGVGGNQNLRADVKGLNLTYQSSKMSIWDLTLSGTYDDESAAANGDNIFLYGVAAHWFLDFADYEYANLLLGIGASVSGDDASGKEGANFGIELPARAVWHPIDHFAVFTQTGFFFDITQRRVKDTDNTFRVGLTTDLLGGAGFNIYF